MSSYHVHPRSSETFGEFVDVFAPVMSSPKGDADPVVIGYVSVGVSLDHEQAQMQMVNWIVAGIGVTAILLSFPAAYLLVFSISNRFVSWWKQPSACRWGDWISNWTSIVPT